MTSSSAVPDPKGTAALGICESLLLALVDRELMTQKEVHDLLTDVADAHLEAAKLSKTPLHDLAVADVIKSILVGKNGSS